MANDTNHFLTEITHRLVRDARSDRERAVRIHDFVRDRVRYGFTARFDDATPSETLATGVGHCNPQTRLFVEMARAAGLEARFHFVRIGGEILRGVLPSAPAEISHGYAEVKLDGRWLSVDSYIVDPQMLAGGRERLLREGRKVGHGVHVDGTASWDGQRDSFGQLADWAMVLEDHGTFETAAEFFASPAYAHRLGRVPFSTLFGAIPSPFFALFAGLVAGRIDRVRGDARPLVAPEPALAAA